MIGDLNFDKPKRQQCSSAGPVRAGSTFLWNNLSLTSAIAVQNGAGHYLWAWRDERWGESSPCLCLCLKVILWGHSSSWDLLEWEELSWGLERPCGCCAWPCCVCRASAGSSPCLLGELPGIARWSAAVHPSTLPSFHPLLWLSPSQCADLSGMRTKVPLLGGFLCFSFLTDECLVISVVQGVYAKEDCVSSTGLAETASLLTLGQRR